MKRRLMASLAGLLGICAAAFASAPAGAAPETVYYSRSVFDGTYTCSYRVIHLTNLYNYPVAIGEKTSGNCLGSIWVIIYSTPDLVNYNEAFAYNTTNPVAVGPVSWYPLNSAHRGCPPGGCEAWWYYHV